jgi:uncharacterized membrane protein
MAIARSIDLENMHQEESRVNDRESLEISKEHLGALMDAVYAIALTILILELPKPHSAAKLIELLPAIKADLINYALSFLLLFNFWFNQRTINDLIIKHSRLTLWLNGFTLLFICLIPYSTFMLHSNGGNEYVDIAYIGNCLVVDALIHLTLIFEIRQRTENKHCTLAIKNLSVSRKIATFYFIVAMLIAIVSPIPNRDILVLIPLMLIFDKEVLLLRRQFLNLVQGRLDKL